MRIAVFGAAGRTGRHVVEQGRARGYEVTAFVRDSSRVPAVAGVTVIEGDAREASSVDTALDGAATVISVLSLAKAQDEPSYSKATRAIVAACERGGVRRVVVAANNHVFTDQDVTGEFAAHAREHRRNREALRGSDLEWTIGAAPWVVDDAPLGSYVTTVGDKAPGRKITTADLATFLLDALDRRDWVRRIVGVSN